MNRVTLQRQSRALFNSRPEESLAPEGECGTDYLLKHTRKNWNPWAWIRIVGGAKDTVCENCGEPEKNHGDDRRCVDLDGTPTETDWKPKTAALSLKVKRTDEGVVVDIFRAEHEDEDPIGSTHAFFSE